MRPFIRPIIQLLLHEYQEFLHQVYEVDQELVFKSVCQMMYAMVDQNHEAVIDKEQKVAHLELLNR